LGTNDAAAGLAPGSRSWTEPAAYGWMRSRLGRSRPRSAVRSPNSDTKALPAGGTAGQPDTSWVRLTERST
jgi:hypothetical protein